MLFEMLVIIFDKNEWKFGERKKEIVKNKKRIWRWEMRERKEKGKEERKEKKENE